MFPIDVAEARIHLPAAGQVRPALRLHRARRARPRPTPKSSRRRPGEITFRTTQPLGPYEGLTVAAAFPKGVVAEPGESSSLGWWLADYGPPLLGLLGLLGLCAFYYVAWKRAGRDPRAGTVVPIFSPPDDLSPAAMRYVTKMGADNRTFAAALVDMGVRGHIRMVEEDGGWLSSDKTRIERLTAGNAAS